MYKRANQPRFHRPSPYGVNQGWTKTEEGIVEPLWSLTPVLPPSLIDLLEPGVVECDTDDENDDIDVEDMIDSDED